MTKQKEPHLELVDVRLLSPALRAEVLKEWRAHLMKPHVELSYLQAAQLYDVPYNNLRTYVKDGRINTVPNAKEKRITHLEMIRFCNTYKPRPYRRVLPNPLLK